MSIEVYRSPWWLPNAWRFRRLDEDGTEVGRSRFFYGRQRAIDEARAYRQSARDAPIVVED